MKSFQIQKLALQIWTLVPETIVPEILKRLYYLQQHFSLLAFHALSMPRIKIFKKEHSVLSSPYLRKTQYLAFFWQTSFNRTFSVLKLVFVQIFLNYQSLQNIMCLILSFINWILKGKERVLKVRGGQQEMQTSSKEPGTCAYYSSFRQGSEAYKYSVILPHSARQDLSPRQWGRHSSRIRLTRTLALLPRPLGTAHVLCFSMAKHNILSFLCTKVYLFGSF